MRLLFSHRFVSPLTRCSLHTTEAKRGRFPNTTAFICFETISSHSEVPISGFDQGFIDALEVVTGKSGYLTLCSGLYLSRAELKTQTYYVTTYTSGHSLFSFFTINVPNSLWFLNSRKILPVEFYFQSI